MAICVQNIVWICLLVIAVLLAVELTRSKTRRHMERECKSMCPSQAPPQTQSPQQPVSDAMMAAVAAMAQQKPQMPMPPPNFAEQRQMQSRALGAALFPEPNNFPASLGWPINQITNPDRVTEWMYTGFIFPSKGRDPGDGKRFPLYARRNMYQSYGWDYMAIDNSRNKVRINIDLPNGVYELQTGDEIPLAGEVGTFTVHIDVPPSTGWQRFLPSQQFVNSWF
jgi:hypothetical protein